MAAAGAGSVLAQTTNAPAASSELQARFLFPTNLALLPGQGAVSKWNLFPKHWTERRTQFWQHREQDNGAVVFLGDSITEGWGGLADAFPGLKIANRGIGGDTTRSLLFRLKEDVLDLEPVAVVLLIGINDIGNGGTPKEAARNIGEILAALKKLNPKMPVVVCKVMPSKKPSARKIRKLNGLVEEIIENDPQLIPCDTWTLFANEDGACYRGEFPDMLHPNRVGYAKWGTVLKPILAGLNLGMK
jgi:lysophospholipase L1-like esterase